MRVVHIIQLGLGQVGRALIKQVLAHRRSIEERSGLSLTYALVSDSRGLAWAHDGLEEEQLWGLLQAKEAGGAIADLGYGEAKGDDQEIIDRVAALGLEEVVLVDVTAAEGMAGLLLPGLERGWGVVLANKKPLVTSLGDWRRLMAAGGERLRYEATVGAGLPIISTLKTLLESGDGIRGIRGSLSGTLSYLCSMLQEGSSFSSAVAEAQKRGYSEPDPRDDLSGLDSARKALILARTWGYDLEIGDVEVESLFPQEMSLLSRDEFMAHLGTLDERYEQKSEASRKRGHLLRYVAQVDEGRCKAGLVEVAEESLLGCLEGPDNLVTFETETYSQNPLVIVGPGAGPDVAAAGVLADIIYLGRRLWLR